MASIQLPIDHFQQRQEGECLAACAVMALTYLGLAADYNRLLKLLEVEPEVGAIFSKVRKLESLGVQVVYKRGNLDELREHLENNRPCIALVKTGELPYWDYSTDHAVVVAAWMTSLYISTTLPFPMPLSRSRMATSAWRGWSEMSFMRLYRGARSPRATTESSPTPSPSPRARLRQVDWGPSVRGYPRRRGR
ncbi:MAG TPA: cysteine peptidase family C39 domain-containing protein [Anaerolineales bacterium]|nr:cysteine peptidase family C39 domain-containing protein [Anaerolineales bacterium]